MSNGMRNFCIFLLVLSPLIMTFVIGGALAVGPDSRGEGAAVTMFALAICGVPFVGVTGILVSLFSRKRADAKKFELLGYLIPALITWFLAAMLVTSF